MQILLVRPRRETADGGLPIGAALHLLHDLPGFHRRCAGPPVAVRAVLFFSAK